MAAPAQQLENELVSRPDRVMVIAGVGVSLGTSDNNACASWKGLLHHGLQRCQEVCGTDSNLINAQRAILDNPRTPTHGLIGVGQFITDELKRHRVGSFGQWLSDSIGGIALKDIGLARALTSLGARLATTNYDNLIEASTGRSPITWQDRALATNFFREPTQDVLHLHGHYRQPETVVLGARSYAEVCREEFVQTALRGLMIHGTLVFVGCGTGLEDPNFGVLLEWARVTLAVCPHSHFILVRSGEMEFWRAHLQGIPVEPVPYGAEYPDLTRFIQGLVETVQRRRVNEPLSRLSAWQTNFDAGWEELERDREQLPALEYFCRSRMLAAELWRAG